MSTEKKAPSLIDALIPILALVIMLSFSVLVFYSDDSSYGPNQIALILAAAIGVLVGFKNGYTWVEMEKGIVKGISMALGAILILLMVGSLIGTWILSGTVPTMVYYGLLILEPSIFYAAACIICALVSLSIGSSWTTAGTVGIALIAIATGMDMSVPITAGAVISGSYFGDKMSPLSDTTNLAPAVAGTDLFTHIRHMTWTTVPSILFAIIVFALIGFMQDTSTAEASMGSTTAVLSREFNISLWALLPLLIVLVLAFKKAPAFLTLLVGALAGGLFAVILQPEAVVRSVEAHRYACEAITESDLFEQCDVLGVDLSGAVPIANLNLTLASGEAQKLDVVLGDGVTDQVLEVRLGDQLVDLGFSSRNLVTNMVDAVWRAFFEGYNSNSGDAAVDDLLSRGGMSDMMNTVWLIICALTFGAVLETIGLLQRLVDAILGMTNSVGGMIAAVIGTCIGTNIIAADQYIAIVLPGRMYRAEFKRRNLHPKNLSRVLEDSATITSPLVPWNTCGVYMAGVLGVPTLVYLPYCFFNLVNPLVSLIYGFTHFKLTKLDEEPAPQAV